MPEKKGRKQYHDGRTQRLNMQISLNMVFKK